MSVSVIIKPGDSDFYQNIEPVAEKKAAGYIVVDSNEVASTIACVHCGAHWIPVKGSGRKRGWCFTCAGPLCGAPACMQHCSPGAELAWERQMDIAEKAARKAVA